MSADTSSVHPGKMLGYLLLSLVDALLPPVFIFFIGILVVPSELLDAAFVYLVGAAGLSFVGAAIAAFILVRHGGKPFPVTRGTKAVVIWVLHWFP
jgi:ABC-type transport system involved in cytochrome c biogenesis permease component